MTRVKFWILWASVSVLWNCAGNPSGSDKFEVPTDMPEICQGIDFSVHVEMREMCGVKARNYRSYKNIPQYRLLIQPKDGKIIKKGSEYELRLPNMVPIELPDSMVKKIDFSEKARRQYIKSTWDYKEVFPKKSFKRIRVMRINIPLNDANVSSVCYTIMDKKRKASSVQGGYADQMEILDCAVYEKFKLENE